MVKDPIEPNNKINPPPVGVILMRVSIAALSGSKPKEEELFL